MPGHIEVENSSALKAQNKEYLDDAEPRLWLASPWPGFPASHPKNEIAIPRKHGQHIEACADAFDRASTKVDDAGPCSRRLGCRLAGRASRIPSEMRQFHRRFLPVWRVWHPSACLHARHRVARNRTAEVANREKREPQRRISPKFALFGPDSVRATWQNPAKAREILGLWPVAGGKSRRPETRWRRVRSRANAPLRLKASVRRVDTGISPQVARMPTTEPRTRQNSTRSPSVRPPRAMPRCAPARWPSSRQ